jgi:hypothetical protein
MDEHLIALARAAEAGEPRPQVRLLLAGGEACTGVPCSFNEFLESQVAAYRREWRTYAEGRSRAERRQEPIDPDAKAQSNLRVLREADAGDEPSALHLGDAELWPITGDGVALPGIRIPFSAVTAWWISGGSRLRQKGGATWFVGAVFPVGDG